MWAMVLFTPGHLHYRMEQRGKHSCSLIMAGLHRWNDGCFTWCLVPSTTETPHQVFSVFFIHSFTDLISKPPSQANQHPWEMSALVSVPWKNAALHTALTSPTSTKCFWVSSLHH